MKSYYCITALFTFLVVVYGNFIAAYIICILTLKQYLQHFPYQDQPFGNQGMQTRQLILLHVIKVRKAFSTTSLESPLLYSNICYRQAIVAKQQFQRCTSYF